ncbi:DNA starvation/stationary phase protection protein [Paenibacillus sp. ACRRX]|uniref:Dps family protein n=1 Tax=unclassified Paenibacillus TaxID=185978 RepID=UPI001EF52014|nr:MULTISPECIES: DNA starvation/stationary phase protection protein [unclassified Paenibacillus]MCG7405824.1 DNA starvation/stationary phase protection protein [Paenibacillus sp. ACRRX]MDK8182269.1 DNA starvation/stationary phase protection protein [Paenibacillus sp. UMB4589-SE434]
MAKENLQKLLNQEVANLNVLYVKLHNYHWFVKGHLFFTLHEKFEELYNDVTLKMDEVAERLLTIGGKPYATMKEYLAHTTLGEGDSAIPADKMVKQLIADFNQLNKEFEEAMAAAEEAGDEATSDMFLGIKSDFEKHVWMLDAYMG